MTMFACNRFDHTTRSVLIADEGRGVMRSFVTNLHVRGADPAAVIAALRAHGVVPAYVRGSADGVWTSVYPDAADQDEAALADIARELSQALSRLVIGFIVH